MTKYGFSALLILIVFASPMVAADGADRCAGARDLRLVNGKIISLDHWNTVLSEITIQNGLIADGKQKLNPCTKVINLRGRTAIPGIIGLPVCARYNIKDREHSAEPDLRQKFVKLYSVE